VTHRVEIIGVTFFLGEAKDDLQTFCFWLAATRSQHSALR